MLSLAYTYAGGDPTLEIDNLCDKYTIPQDDVEHLDTRYRSSPNVLYFISKCEQIVIHQDR
jgi:hypothetical protein